jgi:hypothetical protein
VKQSEILDVINVVERQWPVDTWRVDSIAVWPVLRVRVAMAATLARLGGGKRASLPARTFGAAERLVAGTVAPIRSRVIDAAGHASPAAADMLLLSDGVSLVDWGGGWSDRLLEPLVAAAHRLGRTALVLDPAVRLSLPRRRRSVPLRGQLDRARLRSVAKVSSHIALEGLDEVAAALTREFGAAGTITRREATRSARAVEAAARVFEAIVAVARPRFAAVNNYYSPDGMAFVLACRRRGVPIADIQHGLQGPHHFAYGRWARVPAGGFSLLPDEFWVWGEREAAAIDTWRLRTGAPHRPFVTGNLGIATWRQLADMADPRIVQLLELAGERALVLATLSWGMDESEDRKLIAAARATQDSHFWALRLHPMAIGDRGRIEQFVADQGAHNVEIAVASAAPLYSLLLEADAHVTHSSTVIIEAATLGVPSVITSSFGGELYPEEIGDGLAVVAKDVPAIAAALRTLARSRRSASPPPPEPELSNVLKARLAGPDAAAGAA